MKRLVIVAVLVVVALVALGALAVLLVNPEELRAPIERAASEALGRSVRLERLGLGFFPVPALTAEGLRIAGDGEDAPPMAEVQELRLRVSLLPLLSGRVVLRSVELRSPTLRLPAGPDGMPSLPLPPGEGAAAGGKESPPEQGEERARVAIDSIRIVDGRLESGPWLVEALDLDGRLGGDGTAELSLEGKLPELLELRGTDVSLAGLGGDALEVKVKGEIADAQIAGLARRFEVEGPRAGTASGDFDLVLRGGTLVEGSAALRARDLVVERDGLRLEGSLPLRAKVGEEVVVDLEDVSIVQGTALHKERGVPLRLTAALEPPVSLERLERVVVALADTELGVRLQLAGKTRRLELEATTLELAHLRPYLGEAVPELGGRVRLDRLGARLDPFALSGALGLEEVEFELPDAGKVALSGVVQAREQMLSTPQLHVRIGGQNGTVQGIYSIDEGRLGIDATLEGADALQLLEALADESRVAGTLDARVHLEGPPDLAKLTGSGALDLREGRITGFSLIQQVLGDLAALPVLVAQLKGKDLSRYAEEDFERLFGNWVLRDGRLRSSDFTLVYRYATAHLQGSVGLVDSSLDLSGKIVLQEEVDAELQGVEPARGRERVIPIAAIGGTLDAPRVRLDPTALAGIAATLASGGEVREKLEEEIGPEGAKAVQDLLEGILGGGKKKESPPE